MSNEQNHHITSLVTGGAGFIGSHVAMHCLRLGHKVVVLDDLSGGFVENVPDNASFVEGSVCDPRVVKRLFKEFEFDYVYHLAAYAAEGLSHFIRRFNYTNNLIGSVTLINEAIRAGTKCFVFASSIAVYGRNQLPMDENMIPHPEDPYGISKYAVELDLQAAKQMFDLNYIIFRPHNVYGEHQNVGDPFRNVIGIFIRQIMQGEPLTVFGDGEQTRAFSHIDDVAPHIARSVHVESAYGEVINIGADSVYSINDLIKVVGNTFGSVPSVVNLQARKEVSHAYSSHAKAASLLASRPTMSLDAGVQRMADWVRRVGIRSSKRFAGIEIEKKFPPSWSSSVEKAEEVPV